MFYYIKNEEDAKNLYTIFVEVYNNEIYKNLSENDQYKLIEHIYFEKYVKLKQK